MRGDDFETEIRRMRQEAEVLARDPNYNPYLLLPERQHDPEYETQLYLARESRPQPLFEPRYDTYHPNESASRSRVRQFKPDMTAKKSGLMDISNVSKSGTSIFLN